MEPKGIVTLPEFIAKNHTLLFIWYASPDEVSAMLRYPAKCYLGVDDGRADAPTLALMAGPASPAAVYLLLSGQRHSGLVSGCFDRA
jgi:hypothetical protein